MQLTKLIGMETCLHRQHEQQGHKQSARHWCHISNMDMQKLQFVTASDKCSLSDVYKTQLALGNIDGFEVKQLEARYA